MVKTYLEEALENIIYEDLDNWRISNINSYSLEKKMFNYQIKALENAVKALYMYFKDNNINKAALYDLCISEGMEPHSFDIKENDNTETKSKFDRLSKKYNIKTHNGSRIISEKELFNRMCFWMATGSGKTLVLIKLIEIIDYLQRKNLIPKKEIMILLPNTKIQQQFENEIDVYNLGKDRPIHLLPLKKYEEKKNNFVYELENKIHVFVYRTDLLSEEETAKRVDTSACDNGGNWYILLDEAHKGDKTDSLRQDYITILSRNGFLFNFSATFTDAIDFATTCFNFNLRKFIEAKYGKNIYLSNSNYNFKKGHDDLNLKEKQLQVFKSLITFTLIKKAKKKKYYHNPLMITLVNEVNTKNADTDMFFEELGKIANSNFDISLFETAKKELFQEFIVNKNFQFGKECLYLDDNKIKKSLHSITIKDILKYVYNADNPGVIEVLEGEKGKEFALKLQSSDTPFALFRIGDASQYIRDKLVNNYLIINSYEETKYFDSLNNEEGANFNILIGSRMFYEGWDSNRPNVMNFINIGKGDAKKFVLQSLGRGIRIQPEPENPKNRQRLPANDSNKEQLLETLFVFATNKAAVTTILETINTQKSDEITLQLKANDKKFDLFIPLYADKIEKLNIDNLSKFNISKNAYIRFCNYLSSFNDNLLLLKTNISLDNLKILKASIQNSSLLFKFNSYFDYNNMELLLNKIINHLSNHDKEVVNFKFLDDEVIHYNHIKIEKEKYDFYSKPIFNFLNTPSTPSIDVNELFKKYNDGVISLNELTESVKLLNPETDITINDLRLIKLQQHCYLPLILSEHEKLNYIKHIIDVKSEYNFINNLTEYIKKVKNKFDYDWMFTKIDQTIDNKSLSMPYFSSKDNNYHSFYPDFIFWLKKGTEYKIVFVDPKGTEYASYLSKVDAFEKLFYENGKPKIFNFMGYNITFELKLYYNELGTIPEKYKNYWLSEENFNWLK